MSVCDDRVRHEARQSYEALRASLFTEQESRWLEEIWNELERVSKIADNKAKLCAEACRKIRANAHSECELQDETGEMTDSDADFYDGFTDGCNECIKAINAMG